MAAILLDGAAVARHINSELKQRVTKLSKRGVQPGLAAVQLGDNPAARIYVHNKVRVCAEVGLYSEVHRLDADCPERVLLTALDKLNLNSRIHGIIVQLPLPRHLDTARIVQSIAVDKDVDGFNWRNLGALVDGHPLFVPCTPQGVMTLLDRTGIPVEGRHAVVIGRSGIVGKPMALLLIGRGATVTVCNSKTPNLAHITRQADILVVAAGRPGLVSGEMVKPGATVIDVGINRLPNGKLVGDVDFEGAQQRAAYITPVPGGVGPMTVAMLVDNTVTAAERCAAAQLLAAAPAS
ncbi:MAG: bifunctional methylenetetrahydrofolate dehydrogenase/methenyltetrahydrofolate cyclohydrolase FolD [Pseudomonadota bacterium]